MANNFLRPLRGVENGYAIMHDVAGVATVVFTTWIDSKRLITDDEWKKCFGQLQREIPHLRLTIVWHEGKRYFKYMDTPRVHFEMINLMSEDGWEKVHEDVTRVMFDTTKGPLWRVKIARMPEGGDGSTTGNDISNGSNSFTSVLVFGVHHSILDGTSNLFVLNRLLHILNAVMSGVPYDDGDVVVLQPALEDLLPRDVMSFTWRDYIQMAKSKFTDWFPRKSLYMSRYPPPPAIADTYTKTVAVEFSVQETERFIAKCKDHGTTVHGAFFAAASMAMASMVNDGKPPRSYNIASTHAVNMRRFLDPELSTAIGVLVCVPVITLTTPTAATRSGFWIFAKKATEVIHSKLNNGDIIQFCKLWDYLGEDNVRRTLAAPDCTLEFGISNIGDCDKLCPPGERDDEVHATRIVTSDAGHRHPKPFLHYLHKFRGRFCYNLDYYTYRISASNAKKYSDLTVELMNMAAGDQVGIVKGCFPRDLDRSKD